MTIFVFSCVLCHIKGGIRIWPKNLYLAIEAELINTVE
jgi:hypothetical protein